MAYGAAAVWAAVEHLIEAALAVLLQSTQQQQPAAKT